MRLKLVAVPAISSREEVFFSRKRRRRGMLSGPEFIQFRVPQVPPLSAEHQALVDLRREIDLSDLASARALGIRVEALLALERGELRPENPADWPRALEALRDAARLSPER